MHEKRKTHKVRRWLASATLLALVTMHILTPVATVKADVGSDISAGVNKIGDYFGGVTGSVKGYSGYHLGLLMSPSSHSIYPEIKSESHNVKQKNSAFDGFTQNNTNLYGLANDKGTYSTQKDPGGANKVWDGKLKYGESLSDLLDSTIAWQKEFTFLPEPDNERADAATKDTSLLDSSNTKIDDNATRLLFEFPGNAGSKYIVDQSGKTHERNIAAPNSGDADRSKANGIASELLNDFNSALDIEYTLLTSDPKNAATIKSSNAANNSSDSLQGTQMDAKNFMVLIQRAANLDFSDYTSNDGTKYKTTVNGPTKQMKKTQSGSQAWTGRFSVQIKNDNPENPIDRTLVFAMPKGYVNPQPADSSMTGYYRVEGNDGNTYPDKERTYLNWKDIALAAGTAWVVNGTTAENVDQSSGAIDKFGAMINNWLYSGITAFLSLLQMANISDLVYGRASGIWQSDSNTNSPIPQPWTIVTNPLIMAANVLGFFCIILGGMILIFKKAGVNAGIPLKDQWKARLYYLLYSAIMVTFYQPILMILNTVNLGFVKAMFILAGPNWNVIDSPGDSFSIMNLGLGAILAICVTTYFFIRINLWYAQRAVMYLMYTITVPIMYGYDTLVGNTEWRSSVSLWQEILGVIFAQSVQALLVTVYSLVAAVGNHNLLIRWMFLYLMMSMAQKILSMLRWGSGPQEGFLQSMLHTGAHILNMGSSAIAAATGAGSALFNRGGGPSGSPNSPRTGNSDDGTPSIPSNSSKQDTSQRDVKDTAETLSDLTDQQTNSDSQSSDSSNNNTNPNATNDNTNEDTDNKYGDNTGSQAKRRGGFGTLGTIATVAGAGAMLAAQGLGTGLDVGAEMNGQPSAHLGDAVGNAKRNISTAGDNVKNGATVLGGAFSSNGSQETDGDDSEIGKESSNETSALTPGMKEINASSTNASEPSLLNGEGQSKNADVKVDSRMSKVLGKFMTAMGIGAGEMAGSSIVASASNPNATNIGNDLSDENAIYGSQSGNNAVAAHMLNQDTTETGLENGQGVQHITESGMKDEIGLSQIRDDGINTAAGNAHTITVTYRRAWLNSTPQGAAIMRNLSTGAYEKNAGENGIAVNSQGLPMVNQMPNGDVQMVLDADDAGVQATSYDGQGGVNVIRKENSAGVAVADQARNFAAFSANNTTQGSGQTVAFSNDYSQSAHVAPDGVVTEVPAQDGHMQNLGERNAALHMIQSSNLESQSGIQSISMMPRTASQGSQQFEAVVDMQEASQAMPQQAQAIQEAVSAFANNPAEAAKQYSYISGAKDMGNGQVSVQFSNPALAKVATVQNAAGTSYTQMLYMDNPETGTKAYAAETNPINFVRTVDRFESAQNGMTVYQRDVQREASVSGTTATQLTEGQAYVVDQNSNDAQDEITIAKHDREIHDGE